MAALTEQHFAAQKSTQSKQLAVVNKNITNIDIISNHKDLQKVDLSKNQIKNAKALRKCKKIHCLKLCKNSLSRMKFVISMTNLTALNLSENRITDMSPVSSLSVLKALILAHNKITDVVGLEGTPHLQTLVLSDNQIEYIDVSCLHRLTKLQLSHNKIEVFPDLNSNGDLQTLSLNTNLLTCVPLDAIGDTDLEHVDLGNNKINKLKYIKPLYSISTMKKLNLKGNKVCGKDYYTKKILKRFPHLVSLDSSPVSRFQEEFHKSSDSDQSATEIERPPNRKKMKKRHLADSETATEDGPKKKRHRDKLKDKETSPQKVQTDPQTSVHIPPQASAGFSAPQKLKRKASKKSSSSKQSDSGVLHVKQVTKLKQTPGNDVDIFQSLLTNVGAGTESCW